MPDYRAIHNTLVTQSPGYCLPGSSRGLRVVMESASRLRMLSGRSLDVGCGTGAVVEYLSAGTFDLVPFGVDISDLAIERALENLSHVPGSPQRLLSLDSQSLPFEDDFFSLVTCMDVLEHLDEADVTMTLEEIQRVARKGAVILISVVIEAPADRGPESFDLYRTLRSIDWGVKQVQPDRAEFDGLRKQLTLWKHVPVTERPKASGVPRQQQPAAPTSQQAWTEPAGEQLVAGHPRESAELYQRIYDENPWYGNAEEGRCPGVRLLPEYQDWLQSPVMDLGCGRGQTVEKLRELGMQAEGIDQIELNPDMRVGDITQPIEGLDQFQSVVCIDCIEHLYEDQVLGLFENMKQVRRQAFSIHNGESTGTGQELHVNRKSFVDWTKLIREHFDVASAIQLHENQILYLTQSKQSS